MLKKKFQSYPLTGKLNTKIDPKALPMPNLLQLYNGRRNKEGKISKRFGSTALGTEVTGRGERIGDCDALSIFKEELLVFQNQALYGYSEQGDISSYKGVAISASVETSEISRDNYNKVHVDCATYDNISVFAYDKNPGIAVTVVDNVTGTELLSNWAMDNSGTRPRCVAFQGLIYVYYVNGNDLNVIMIPPTNPRAHTITTISNSVNSVNYSFDAIAMDTFMCVAYNVTAATQIRLHKVSADVSVLATANIAEAATGALTLVRGASSTIFALWYDGTDVRVNAQTQALTQTVAPATVETIANVQKISAYKLPADTGIRVFYEISAASTYNYYTKHNTVTNSGTIGTAAVFLRSVGIASRAWAYSPDTTDLGFICLTHESSEQSSFFVARNDGTIVAKIKYSIGGGILSRNMPANVSEISSGKFQFALLSKTQIVSSDNRQFFTIKGASSAIVDFSNMNNFSSAQIADNCLIAGGLIQSYDSHSVVENNFNLYPENVSLAQSNAAGTLTLLGVYSYCVCYEWTDNKGQIHRSSPSTPVSITLTGANDTVTLTIPTLRLTNKRTIGEVYRAEPNIIVYRTTSLGTVYYQVNPITTLLRNDVTADTVSFVDEVPDSTLIQRPPLYTTGEVIENIAPPSANLITIHKDRVWLAGTEDDSLWYSKLIKPNSPVEFSDLFVKRVDGTNGRNKAICSMDDKLLVFKRSAIFYLSGDGEDDTGVNGSINPSQTISLDIGTEEPKSVVDTPLGVIFKSLKGFYLISSDLQLRYVGAPIEEFNGESVNSSALVSTLNEVRFVTDNYTLVYNYEFDEWSVWNNCGGIDCVLWRENYIYIKKRPNLTDALVKEDMTVFTDLGQSYNLRVKIAFAQFAQLQGFQRVWRAFLLGEYKSKHKLKISVSYDYKPYITDEYYWDAQTNLDIETYGDSSYYGTDEVYGGSLENSGTYQVRVHLSQQKCQAVCLTIEDTAQEGTCESFDLSSIGFEYGYKYGGAKLQEGQTL